MSTPTILITDHAWPDLEIERSVIEAAGLRWVHGPASPASDEHITALAQQHQPASILTCWAQVSAKAIAASQGLMHVGRIGVGLDNIDVSACTQAGVLVTNVPDYCVEEVSDHALSMTLAWARGLISFDRDVRAGQWNPAKAQLRRMANLTVGIIGFGRIGRASARKFQAFSCRVLVTASRPITDAKGVEAVELSELLSLSDVVVLHVPLTPQTQGLINQDRIASMKPGALLINVSRGAVVDTAALTQALASGHLSGAGLDVLDTEPKVPPTLINQSSVMFTPHIAFSSDAAVAELRRRAAEEAVRVVLGQAPHHPCNTPRAVHS